MILVVKELREIQVHKVVKETLVLRETQVYRELKGIQVRKVIKAILV